MRTVNYNYQHLNQADYLAKFLYIIFCLTSNANFPALPFEVAVLIAKKLLYEEQLNKSKAGDHIATTKANSIKKEINQMIKKNGIYINDVCNGDEAMLESSGYDLSKEKEFKEKADLTVESTNDPTVAKGRIKVIENALIYLIEVAEVPASQNVSPVYRRLPLTSQTYFLITSIEKYKPYLLKYCAGTREGESETKGPFPFSIS